MILPLPVLILLLTVLYGTGALAALLGRDRPGVINLSLCLALVASVVCAVVCGAALFGNSTSPARGEVLFTTSWLEAGDAPPLQIEARLDRLAAFFGLLASSFAALIAIYSSAALKADHFQYQRWQIAAAFNIFTWATLMVVFANDLFSLITALELMTLAFAFLALYKHFYFSRHPDAPSATQENLKEAGIASQAYLIASHTSTALLLAGMVLLSVAANRVCGEMPGICSSGGLSFDTFRSVRPFIDSGLANLIFILVLAGLVIRAGITPAHMWVPLVHPNSPTPTHAFSLGIAIKVSIYLMLRFFFEFLTPQPWWGFLVLGLGVVTALVNVWYAISCHDLKRALAYHSEENIGIIVAGVGLALIFFSMNLQTPMSAYEQLASLALLASLYHLANHAVFKGLLYLATGAVDNLTHQVVDLKKLGGLANLYPFTALAFFVGALSISGFPPFNGFASEWLTLQTFLKGTALLKVGGTGGVTFVLVMTVMLLLLVAAFGLTAYCFYKITGLAFLGQPRLREEERQNWSKNDVPARMKAVMAVLMLLCLAMGLFSGWVAERLSPLIMDLVGEKMGVQTLDPSTLWIIPANVPGEMLIFKSDFFNPFPMVAFGTGILVFLILMRTLVKVRRSRRSAPWNCGTPYSPENTQPTGASLSYLSRNFIGSLFSSRSKTHDPEYLTEKMWVAESQSFPQQTGEPFRHFLNILIHFLLTLSSRIGGFLQNRDIRRYLGYIFLANLLILLFYLLMPRP
jgi:hydrogenase-4 component B